MSLSASVNDSGGRGKRRRIVGRGVSHGAAGKRICRELAAEECVGGVEARVNCTEAQSNGTHRAHGRRS